MISSSLARFLLGGLAVVSVGLASPALSYAQAACASPKDVFLNPFSAKSAHHRPIGTGAQYASDSHPATRDWLKAGSFGINVGGPWGVDAVTVSGNDPVMRVAGKSPSINLPATVRLPGNGHKTKIGYNPMGTTDGVTVIHDRSNGQTHQLYQYDWNNGKPNASIYRAWNIKGLGHGTRSGQRLGTSASGVAGLFGLLRGHEVNQEVNQSGRPIEHALQIALPRIHWPNQTCSIMLSKEVQLPATTRDGSAGAAGNNTGNIPYGALLALPRDVNVNSLGLSEPGRRLAQAIQNYGIYVVDGGGCKAGAIRADQDVSGSVLNQLSKDIPKIYRRIRMVLNNNVMGSPVAGGGKPLAPNCAFDAGATRTVAETPTSGSSTSVPSTNQSQQQASNSAKSAGAPPTGGSSSASAPSGKDWELAVDYWKRSYWNKKKMDAAKPGSDDYNLWRRNYEHTIALYIQHAAKAGVKVDANTPPEQAVKGRTAHGKSSTPSTNQAQGGGKQQASAGGAKQSVSGSDAAKYWAKAVRFYEWAMMAYRRGQVLGEGGSVLRLGDDGLSEYAALRAGDAAARAGQGELRAQHQELYRLGSQGRPHRDGGHTARSRGRLTPHLSSQVEGAGGSASRRRLRCRGRADGRKGPGQPAGEPAKGGATSSAPAGEAALSAAARRSSETTIESVSVNARLVASSGDCR